MMKLILCRTSFNFSLFSNGVVFHESPVLFIIFDLKHAKGKGLVITVAIFDKNSMHWVT